MPRRRAASALRAGLLFAAITSVSWTAAAVTDRPGMRLAVAQRSQHAASDAAQAAVNGVIVQLRDAAANVPDGLAHAPQLAKAAATSVQAAPDARRWSSLLKTTGLDRSVATTSGEPLAAVSLKPVGASAQLLTFTRRLTMQEAGAVVERLTAQAEVEWVVPNSREQRLQAASGVGATNPPNDPLFAGAAQQWWLQPVSGSDSNTLPMRLRGVPGIQSVWQRNTGATVVAVLDTGITAHPELAGRVLPGYDFVSDWDPLALRGYANDGDGRDADPSDPGDGVTPDDATIDPARYKSCTPQFSSWHGTIIAGMLAGATDNGQGVAAMQWNGRVVPVRVAGKCGAEVADVIDGMRWAAGLPVAGVPTNANPARIINMSFGGDAPCNAAYAQAIRDIGAAPGGGAVLIAAAGNRFGATARPSNCPGAVGVAALNRDGFKTTYSSFGSTVTLATVGGDDGDGRWGPLLADSGLLTITNDGEYAPGAASYANGFGTSFSAPIVSGVAALMLSVNPGLNADQLLAGLRFTTRPHVVSPYLAACSELNPGRCACTTSTCGLGILDAEQAVLYAADPKGYVKPAAAAVVIDNSDLKQAALAGPDREPNPGALAAVDTGGGSSGVIWTLCLLLAAGVLQGLPKRQS